MQQLNRQNTSRLVQYPPRVLQFGGGNFLRAFVDWMIEELNVKTDFGGSVIVVKPTPTGNYAALRSQEGLFHVLTRGVKNGRLVNEQQLISCIQEIIHPYQAWETYLQSAELESIRFVVSNTTEAGIQFRETDQWTDQPAKAFPAKLTQWLYHRFQYFEGAKDKGCILLPCELIENNADALKKCILQYAALWQLEEDFAIWINTANHFCNTLVDRIVPGYPAEDARAIQQEIGYKDHLLVAAEPYHLWTIEGDETIQQELPFEKTNLNVVFTDHLAPYRELKVRILNGAHIAMVPIGYLSGLESVREALEDETVGTLIADMLDHEILPTLDYPKAQLEQYKKETLDRFKNPFIHHRLIDISLNAIPKFKARLLPSLKAYVEQFGHAPRGIATVLAYLIHFYKGARKGENIPLKASNEVVDFFQSTWAKYPNDFEKIVDRTLGNEAFWGMDLRTLGNLSKVVVERGRENFCFF
ncbi:MAG: tagaturonate reductase [Bacteroidota bacterium]